MLGKDEGLGIFNEENKKFGWNTNEPQNSEYNLIGK